MSNTGQHHEETPRNEVAKAADKFMHGKGIFTFLRSTVSSQLASWTDMGVAFVFFAWVFRMMADSPMRTFISTAIGLGRRGGQLHSQLQVHIPGAELLD